MSDISLVAPDRIRVNVGVTRNLGDFNSVRLDLSYDTAIGNDETFDEAAARAWAAAEKQVEEQLSGYESD